MKHVLTIFVLLFLSGCAATSSFYPYLAINNDCNCKEYNTTAGNIEYTFRALYRMEHGVSTMIDIEIENHGSDTLSLQQAFVKVSSRNVQYQYNDKFVPMPALLIPPGRSENIRMEGNSRDAKEDWNIIAGERLTVTTRGMRLGRKVLPEMSVEFVPVNPKMTR